MTSVYQCPSCETNRSRFNIIEQVVQSVRKDPMTGEIVEVLSSNVPHHIYYQGEKYRVQCGVCGWIESEHIFIKRAQLAEKH